MIRYGHNSEQLTIPFADLPPLNTALLGRQKCKEKGQPIEDILANKDATLLFMRMAVTHTSKNEMPIVHPYTGNIPDNIMGFYRVASSGPYSIVPHFYFDDKRMHHYWNHPFRTAEVLSHFPCSIGLDLSMTNDMLRPQKMYASYLNKLWVAWLQSRGHEVIPNVSFPDEWEEDYWLEGWPIHSVIAINSVGVLSHGNPKEWLKAVERIRTELKPTYILRYGALLPGENTENCTYFANDNNRAAYGR